MKKVFWKFIIVTILSLLFISLILAESKMRLTISMNQTKYIEGEQIFLTLALHNDGNNDCKYTAFFHWGGFMLSVKGSDGKNIPYQGGIPNYLYKEHNLRAGDSILDFLILSNVYPTIRDRKGPSMCAFSSRMKPDEYTVQAIYCNFLNPDNPHTDTLISNTIRFRVESVPTEEKETFGYLDSVFANVYSKKANDQMVEAFTTFITRYPKSYYLPIAKIYHSRSLQRVKKTNEANQALVQIINEYPESDYAVYTIYLLEQPEEEKEKTLMEIASKHKNVKSRVDVFAKQMIEVIKSKK